MWGNMCWFNTSSRRGPALPFIVLFSPLPCEITKAVLTAAERCVSCRIPSLIARSRRRQQLFLEHTQSDTAKSVFYKKMKERLLYLELPTSDICCVLPEGWLLSRQLRYDGSFTRLHWIISKPLDELEVNSVWTGSVVRIRALPCVRQPVTHREYEL